MASRISRRALLGACLLAAAAAARADDFLGGDWTTGDGYRGFDVKAGMDLGAGKDWEGDATYSYSHDTFGTESRSRQLTLGLIHEIDKSWTGRVSLTGWRDSLNRVDYAGPSWGFTYAAFDDSAAEKRKKWSASFDNDLFLYDADETAVARKIKIAGSTVTIPGGQSAVTLAQWHPYLHVEAPVAAGRLTPSLDYGHYFYSKTPALIEARTGQPRFSASASSLSGLANGLNQDAVSTGVTVKIASGLSANASLGAVLSAVDHTWSTTQGAGLSAYLGESLKAVLSWSRLIQYGTAQDLGTAGLTYYF